MALDNFKEEEEENSSDDYDIGSISTRKKIKNVTLDKQQWEEFIVNSPNQVAYLSSDMDDNSVKAVVETMDSIIQDGIDDLELDDNRLQTIEQARNKVVNNLIKE